MGLEADAPEESERLQKIELNTEEDTMHSDLAAKIASLDNIKGMHAFAINVA